MRRTDFLNDDNKQSVRLASTANLATIGGLSAMDGVTPVAGDRILLPYQTIGTENGIYVAQSGAWTRAKDAGAPELSCGASVYVEEGTINAGLRFTLRTANPITLGTTSLLFSRSGGGLGGSQALSGAGAVNLLTQVTRCTSTGAAQALTLVDGSYVGQTKRIFHAVDGGSVRLTAGAALHLGDGLATITLADVRDWIELSWNATAWDLIGWYGTGVTFT